MSCAPWLRCNIEEQQEILLEEMSDFEAKSSMSGCPAEMTQLEFDSAGME